MVIGATAEGKKELLALTDGYWESEASWQEVLLDLKARGLSIDPHLATGGLEQFHQSRLFSTCEVKIEVRPAQELVRFDFPLYVPVWPRP